MSGREIWIALIVNQFMGIHSNAFLLMFNFNDLNIL